MVQLQAPQIFVLMPAHYGSSLFKVMSI